MMNRKFVRGIYFNSHQCQKKVFSQMPLVRNSSIFSRVGTAYRRIGDVLLGILFDSYDQGQNILIYFGGASPVLFIIEL